jgi:hypothetical protein
MSLKFGLVKTMVFCWCGSPFFEKPGIGCRERGRRLSPLSLLSTVEIIQR